MSIGMSDLAICSLAVDRRSVKVAKLSDLMPAVLNIVRIVIAFCNLSEIESSVFRVRWGNPEIIKTH